MIFKDKYLPKLRYIPGVFRKSFLEGNPAKRKYIWSKVLYQRMENMPPELTKDNWDKDNGETKTSS